MSEIELKSCPFCDSVANVSQYENMLYAVQCKCGANNAFMKTSEEAILQWNTRQPDYQRVIEKIHASKYGMPRMWCAALDTAIAILKEAGE